MLFKQLGDDLQAAARGGGKELTPMALKLAESLHALMYKRMAKDMNALNLMVKRLKKEL